MQQKIIILDDHTVIFGHGMMGTASYRPPTYTGSGGTIPEQEIGVVFIDTPLAIAVQEAMETALQNFVTTVYYSERDPAIALQKLRISRLSIPFRSVVGHKSPDGVLGSAWITPHQSFSLLRLTRILLLIKHGAVSWKA